MSLIIALSNSQKPRLRNFIARRAASSLRPEL
jgi:hypothetical protein